MIAAATSLRVFHKRADALTDNPFQAILRRLTGAARSGGPDMATQVEAIRPRFDVDFYTSRRAFVQLEVVEKGMDPVEHYVRFGAKRNVDPSPDFSTWYYKNANPDVRDSGLNPFYHFIAFGEAEGRPSQSIHPKDRMFRQTCAVIGVAPDEAAADLRARRDDFRERAEKGVVADIVAKAVKLDPSIALATGAAANTVLTPFRDVGLSARLIATATLFAAMGARPAKAVILVPDGRWGGGPRMEGHIARAVSQLHAPEDIVVLRTDREDRILPGRFPDGVRHVNFFRVCEDFGLGDRQRESLLLTALHALRPDMTFAINSKLFWSVLERFGPALTSDLPVGVCFFCDDQDPWGRVNGYPQRYFYRVYDKVAAVVTDSHALMDAYSARYQTPEALLAKQVVLEAPVDPSVPVAETKPLSAGERPTVFWAGRFARQKRLDILCEIARRMPDVDFRLWGGDADDEGLTSHQPPPNVAAQGKYKRFAEVPLGDCALWLYTSEWDGVPSQLLEVAMTGVPLVGSDVGGTTEVLLRDFAAPVAPFDDVDAYVSAIRAVLEDPEAARRRALALREHLLATRTEEAYRMKVGDLLRGGADG